LNCVNGGIIYARFAPREVFRFVFARLRVNNK
jgi:hypothetical protein